MNAVLTALAGTVVGTIATAFLGSFILTSDRLRSAAAADATLLTALEDTDPDAAEQLRNSMLRSVMLATTRNTHPPIVLSEVAALALFWCGLPITAGVAVNDGGFAYWGTFTVVGLLGTYATATCHWVLRAIRRGMELAQHPATQAHDAPEFVRQIWLVLLLQMIASTMSIVLSWQILTSGRHVDDLSGFLAMTSGLAISAAITYLPLRACTLERSGRAPDGALATKSATEAGSAWQRLDVIRYPHRYGRPHDAGP